MYICAIDADCRRLVKENRTLKSNIHKEIEREDELKVLLQKVSYLHCFWRSHHLLSYVHTCVM